MIGKTVAHYRVIDKLGEGGMGVVYKAEDTKLKRTVALKFLPPHSTSDPGAKQRFIREAQAAASLNHPGVCTVYEIGEADGGVYIAMECVEGGSLRAELRSGPLDQGRTLSLAIQVAEALQEAHDKGVVHRDIKPSNIMVTPSGRVKITDFGLAKVSGSTVVTLPGTVFGTVAYMSPEQAGGKSVDHRTDIWALGVVIYEMASGRPPFRGEHPQAVIRAILEEEPEPLATAASGIPAELEHIVARALAKNADDRYQSVAELFANLETLMEGTGRAAPTQIVESSKTRPSIAVMPFADMSPDGDQEYFCDGMSEEIINQLTGLSGLRVIARTSAFSFKDKNEDIREIGRKLDVTSILEGSVRKAGDRVRITAQLIDIADGSHVWSERYDRVLEDVFAVQDEIASAIVGRLRVNLTAGERERLAEARQVNVEAHELYLRGRHVLNRGVMPLLWDPEKRERAIDYYRKAIAVDAGYAPPYAGLADIYNLMCYWRIAPEENRDRAREAAAKALELDDALVEAHDVMGRVCLMADLNWSTAKAEHLRAIELNPGSAAAHRGYAVYLQRSAQFELGIEHAKKARDLDPLAYRTNLVLAFITAGSRRHCGEAVKGYENVLKHFPGDEFAERSLLRHRVRLGIDVDESVRELLSRWPDSTLTAVACARMGRRDEALRIIDSRDRLEHENFHYADARIYAALGEKDHALDLLERAWDEEPRTLLELNTHIELDVLRGEQRFKALIERSGIPMGELAYLSD